MDTTGGDKPEAGGSIEADNKGREDWERRGLERATLTGRQSRQQRGPAAVEQGQKRQGHTHPELAPFPGSAHLWLAHHQPCTTTLPPQHPASPPEQNLRKETSERSHVSLTPRDKSCPRSYSEAVSEASGSQALGIPTQSSLPTLTQDRTLLGYP